MTADAAREGSGDVRELQVERGVPDGSLCGLDGCLVGAQVCGALVNRLRGAEAGLLELLRSPQLHLAQRFLPFRRIQLGDGLIQPDLEWPWIDDEEQVALVHDLPILEVYIGESAANLRTQFNRIHRRELAKEADGGLRRPLQRLAGRDPRR